MFYISATHNLAIGNVERRIDNRSFCHIEYCTYMRLEE